MNKNLIKFLVIDVDGTLTDGKIYMGVEGELFKTFNVRDGAGIKDILPLYGIVPVIMTARSSRIVLNRCLELNITELHQGIRKKYEKLEELLSMWSKKDNKQYTLKNIAYIGDDFIDLACMKKVKLGGGIIGCPANAIEEVKQSCDFLCEKEGGYGAVREFIEWLVRERNKIV